MKIGIVCYPTFGGSGVVATELGKALSEQGHYVHFISYEQPVRLDTFRENIFYHEVSFENYPLFKYPPYEIALTSKIVDVALVNGLDLVHVHYAIPHAAAAVTAKHILSRKGIDLKVVTTLHGTDITLLGKDKAYEPVISYALSESNAVTCVSESLKQDTYGFFDYGGSISVIPNFIDFTRFNKRSNLDFQQVIATKSEKIITHTSNFRKVKRIPDVIDIFYGIQKEIPAKLLLIGDGPLRPIAEEMCQDYGITDKVVFLGKQDIVDELLSVSDLFLLPSETESFGLAALEAMACEVPVISTNTGGLPEVNLDGFSGFNSEVGDVDKMTKDALYILHDNNIDQFKLQAKEQALKFGKDFVINLYNDLYQSLF
jgi:N-acetyl-alpha-D-glucosaminyl L-malate synthase BshA